MFGLGFLSFAAPWALAALALLPVIWWLLKVNPPAPKRISFPPVRFLFNLRQNEETPTKTPLWLVILRLLLATLAILAVAGPMLIRGGGLNGDGALLVVVDDGWSAAAHWPARQDTLARIIDQADRNRRSLYLATTAPSAGGEAVDRRLSGLLTAKQARDAAQALQPKPWPTDRAGLAATLEDAALTEASEVIWLSDGIVANNSGDDARALISALGAIAPIQVYRDDVERLAMVLRPPDRAANELEVTVLRAAGGPSAPVHVLASAPDGQLLARAELRFDDDALAATGKFEIPSELRNDFARLDLDRRDGVGGVVLLDDRWQRRTVGLVSGASFEASQPLLSDLYYLDRALSPYHQVGAKDLQTALDDDLSVLILADIGRLTGQIRGRVDEWVRDGGVLIRFAGPRLAQDVDDLVPVRLRTSGGRALGGALSWDQPMPLSPFAPDSPFAGLTLPNDVLVQRQVLADPSAELADRTWARLADGTPLVTAVERDDGWIVLFHTTANADWSNLALSGLFVDMLRRIVELSKGVAGEAGANMLPPVETLDGFGRMTAPPPSAIPIESAQIDAVVIDPTHPPGLYGFDEFRRAVNLSGAIESLALLDEFPADAVLLGYVGARDVDLRPWLLTAVFLLLLIDSLIAWRMRGLTLGRPGAAAAGGLAGMVVLSALLVGLAPPSEATAQTDVEFAAIASRETRLAYVKTGDIELDRVSEQGLQGLSRVLRKRTAVEPGTPVAVTLETDDLVFYPLLYWPISETQDELSDFVRAKIDDYLRAGGLILLDTGDQAPTSRLQSDAGSTALSRLVEGLNLPPLIPIPNGHALTQSFYLLDRFPGRWDGGRVWVERYEGDVNDGVSSVIIGGNDWAGAWAMSDDGTPLFPVVPGGPRQRETAFRFGVNLVMYALTGNYKADQVHVPAILRRLGRSDEDPSDE